ncbi:hypothetical protein COCHEDRAFT_1138239 [Bipolaris maydis C5]|uniref:Uncharacterized protein n=1 Tax=Cochliobolus heterostrophus (strain C5 / ATCC 48332 / race O) TaxID=701091 RepID=M2TT91_COCH5|nr:hypothetical protein COCHEDRAFT_1138239 [Bipolaris maydis C5]KAJ5025557.1 hypothetical protein J3E73DRAFT_234326 [Bipolaris maydis]KAJ6207578.1 hypothetical protein PSV09DRAFT_1138239 [Bipolaris maydis]KAJ6269772.1 hypothetical protein PSV08DRAFT_204973 [Bipolaris maydis]KAJ6280418.1 hypothetical protein J3E71DRAFT_220130 [Bipolaris maydis]
MAGPFRFQEEARSPLDRSASPFSTGQPVSFKTNVNRSKTKKWVQAKKNAYDGDDWGDYDEYDEYGVNQEPQNAQPAQRYYAQRTEQPSRSFTDPSLQAPLPKARRNSFERGEEQRAFSSTIPQPQPAHAQPHREPQGLPDSNPFGVDYDMGGRGDFSPSAVPPPLQTRMSQVPADFTPPSQSQFPPRKSSIGQASSPIATSPRPRTGSASDKPLPFIRPADIYKRHQEDQEHFDPKAIQSDPSTSQQEHPANSPSDDQGLRSVVDQAFTRTDDQRSVPPTPTSNDTSSDLLRSNTGSTSGISPIMSRVPSSAASALKIRNQAEGNTPVIKEEPGEVTTPVTQPTPANNVDSMHHVPQKPSPGHSRNISSSSTPRSGLATPTRGDSPARSPVLAASRDVPRPKSALFLTEDDSSPEGMDGGLKGPASAYANREADLATSTNSRPSSGILDLGAAQRQSQNMFLESHNAQSPIEDVLPRDRSESPSKGRVQALAGKFGDVASSRRGSTQSNLSRNSVQSWERSRDNSRAASPTKASPSKPSSPVKEFRPHLPGQWESYTTTVVTPSEHGEQDRGLGNLEKSQVSSESLDLTPTTAKQSVAEVPSTEANNSDPMAALRNAGAAMAESIRTTIGIDENSSETPKEKKASVDHGNIYLPRPLQLDRTITSNSSAPPTPPAKDTPKSEFPPSPPLKENPVPSAEDQESDRLRKEIVASLGPLNIPDSPADEPSLAPLQPHSPGTNRASSILPDEYKSYWAEEDGVSRRSSQNSETKAKDRPQAATVAFLPQSEDPTKPVIKRFSWEASDSLMQTPVESEKETPPAEPAAVSNGPEKPASAGERAAEQEHQPSPETLPGITVHTGPASDVTKPDPVGDGEKPAAPSPLLDPTQSIASPTREATRSPGLHVVNTEENPEAVDLPPRFTAEHDPPPVVSKEPKLTEKATTPEPAEPQPAIEARHEEVQTPAAAPVASAAQESSTKSPATDKPLGAREIATLNSATERIDTYNKTREYWASVDHGLNDWLTATLDANPELATQTFPVQRAPTGSIRHRHTGSLLFGKLGGSSNHESTAEQHNNGSAAAPTNTSSPTAHAPSGSSFGGRIVNQQVQLKGKDLLHTANVLGGKGMTSAKGFFAKGKSRFGREKAEK